jgi:hypothetical protein
MMRQDGLRQENSAHCSDSPDSYTDVIRARQDRADGTGGHVGPNVTSGREIDCPDWGLDCFPQFFQAHWQEFILIRR